MSDHAGPPWTAMTIYHNTFVMAGGTRSGDMNTMVPRKGSYPRRTFNNLFLHMAGLPGYVGANLAANVEADGNLFWAMAVQKTRAAAYFDRYRASEAFRMSKKVYPPGFSTHSLVADPRLVNIQTDWRQEGDYRPRADSPLINAGAELPKDWTDPVKSQDPGRPDIGALPAGTKPLGVGRAAAP